jgi:hypothetical protein
VSLTSGPPCQARHDQNGPTPAGLRGGPCSPWWLAQHETTHMAQPWPQPTGHRSTVAPPNPKASSPSPSLKFSQSVSSTTPRRPHRLPPRCALLLLLILHRTIAPPHRASSSSTTAPPLINSTALFCFPPVPSHGQDSSCSGRHGFGRGQMDSVRTESSLPLSLLRVEESSIQRPRI